MKSFTFTDPGTGFVANLTVTENPDGTLSVVLDVDESTGVTGDIRAMYFNNTDNTFLDGLTVSPGETDGDASTSSDTDILLHRQQIDKVRWVDSKDTNVNGGVIQENDGAFDTGFEFGTQGIGSDDVQHMEFTLSADAPLTIDSFDWTTIGLRVTSVGDIDGSRDGSLKLTGEEDDGGGGGGEPGTVVANDDIGDANLSVLQSGGIDTAFDLGAGANLDWSLNDMDPEGDQFQLTSLSGANGTVSTSADVDGWFGWVDGSLGGEVRVNVGTGEVQVRDADGDFTGEAFAETSVSYEITDDTGATDSANILVFLEALD